MSITVGPLYSRVLHMQIQPTMDENICFLNPETSKKAKLGFAILWQLFT